jgi:exosome complex component RRP4
VFVGQNGRIWIDGDMDDIKLAIKAVRVIEESAHVSGLTNIIENYLKEKKQD